MLLLTPTDHPVYRPTQVQLPPEQLEVELKKAYGGRGSTSAYMLLYREVAREGASADDGEPAHGPTTAATV